MDQVWSRAGVEGERRDLEARAKDLVRFAEQDPLTGLANRRAMEKFCAGLPPREPVCLVLVDVDHFKDVNDRFGHAVGDAVLREVGALLARSVRSVDRVARWGGEEFLVALPGGSAQLGADAADRMRSRVERAAWSLYAPGLRLTVSAGVASGAPDDLDAVLGRADAAMYEAKRAGRNRVVSR
jgi:diguanylate cyclase (GGDEF)-like protein